MKRVCYKIPASSANLGPGFDSLGLALSIYNRVEMGLSRGGLTILAEGEGKHNIPTDKSNLVYRAAQTVFQGQNREIPGLEIILHNEIPLSRGLGSSAAAIVAGLHCANALLDFPLSQQELFKLAVQLEGHPDNVAPAIFGGLVAAAVADNEVLHWRVKPAKPINITLAIPAFPLSTKEARAVLPKSVPFGDAVYNASRVPLVMGAFLNGDYNQLRQVMQDRLHQQYRSSLIPGFDAVVEAAMQAGALSCVLSGAGPTIIAFSVKNGEGIGEAMQDAFREHGVQVHVLQTGISLKGGEITRSVED